MASNREQRRAAKRKGKRPGETYADQLARERMLKEAVNRAAHDESVLLKSDIMTQRLLWMSIEALNRAFGFADIRAQRFMLTLDEVREDLEEMARENGWEYAAEKLRQRCEQITRIPVRQVHEEEMRQARRENEAKGIYFHEDDPEVLAKLGLSSTRETGPKWIPVTERCPDKEWMEYGDETGEMLEVIAKIAHKEKSTAVYYDGHGGFYKYKGDGQKIFYPVTHWTWMPEWPEEAA